MCFNSTFGLDFGEDERDAFFQFASTRLPDLLSPARRAELWHDIRQPPLFLASRMNWVPVTRRFSTAGRSNTSNSDCGTNMRRPTPAAFKSHSTPIRGRLEAFDEEFALPHWGNDFDCSKSSAQPGADRLRKMRIASLPERVWCFCRPYDKNPEFRDHTRVGRARRSRSLDPRDLTGPL